MSELDETLPREAAIFARTISAILALTVTLGCRAAEPERSVAPAPVAPAGPRIVAVGDLHGDLDQAVAVLRLAGLVDEGGAWSGGDAILVQTGDTTDRGPQSKGVMDLMRRLGPEAEAAGGRVVALLGNHEAMNLVGDWRYVSPADVEAFGGHEARLAAFSEAGPYGSWLLERDVVARVGDTVFAHGGVTPEWAAKGLDAVNAEARQALRAHLAEPAAAASSPVLGERGPLWYRGFVQDPAPQACAALARSLRALDAARMVVGHTTRRDGRIQVRCGGRLAVIDIGIAAHYGGNLGALELAGGDAWAVYPSGRVDLEDPSR